MWNLIFPVLMGPMPAFADCGLTMTTNNVSVNWTTSFTYISVPLTINKVGPDPCDFGVGFTKGTAASYATRSAVDGAKQVRYQLFKESALANILKDVPDVTNANEVIQGGFAGGLDLLSSNSL